MDTFNPIVASRNIKESFVDYITTTFELADPVYSAKFRKELHKPGYVSKGPFLELSGSYKAGHSIESLIQSGEVSSLFRKLEPVPEKERELKLERPLYLHQEQALKKASAGNNLVVTTGTGSGKTECFLLPLINSLLKEKEGGTLNNGVRAIIIYPMNALANDQIKRMRALFAHYPDITFGLYIGNTEHEYANALKAYRGTYGANAKLLPNELIARSTMQDTPPHILITNYSMLEYMMLRPKDDKVFSSAKLRFIVLDEAHIYKGTTGMETAMLMRRLRARINTMEKVQYILTSATLGGKDADQDILKFAYNLCGVNFTADNIIRSQDATPKMIDEQNFPIELFSALANRKTDAATILEQYSIPDPCPSEPDEEKLYELLLRTHLFKKLMEAAHAPISIASLREALRPCCSMTEQQLIDFITVCSQAEKGKSSLIKARYHFFVRALEGAYVTLNEPVQLFLNRQSSIGAGESRQEIFEIAICSDCGRLALVGKENEGYLTQISRKAETNPKDCDYYLVVSDESDKGLIDLDDEDDDTENELAEGENDYVVCPRCGRLTSKADLRFGPICACPNTEYIHVVKVKRTKKEHAKCPACGLGEFYAFYLGNEAATSVLGTELFEQLPDEQINLEATIEANRPVDEDDPFSFFAESQPPQTITKSKERQFLCFSDSRSEAAFFATYMEKSYAEFLRRRGMWHVIEKMCEEGETLISIATFVNRLTQLFDAKHTFRLWNPDEKTDMDYLHEISKKHAWIAVLNEMFNGRRSTSLPSMGMMSFEFKPNHEERFVKSLSDKYKLSSKDVMALLDLIVMDAVHQGAISPGRAITLTPADREYIFFSQAEKELVKTKVAGSSKSCSSWAGRKRENGNYYPNIRLQRLANVFEASLEEADIFLTSYWEKVFRPAGDTYTVDANDFVIRVHGDPDLHVYRCKKCGRVTTYNVSGKCAYLKCGGELEETTVEAIVENNHYANLYRSERMSPLQIKEHTAQLAKDHQTLYQQAFVDKKINALSCSTTFEMGVDVGSLETVYMRNVPPSPANYVQRAGRAGRGLHSAAFVLTYVKLSSHDLTFYRSPESIISGKIKVPVFALENEKVINRHIYAVALSMFLARNEDVYGGDNASVFLNEDGYDRFKDYLLSSPEPLKDMLRRTLPKDLLGRFKIETFGWVDGLIGEEGVLEKAVLSFKGEVKELETQLTKYRREKNDSGADQTNRALRMLRCGPEDGQRKRSLIEFLARNNVLPKYGFPVDTVELHINAGNKKTRTDSLQLARDLQMAIAEYAPGAEVIADGKLYTSRYIRKDPGKGKKDSWAYGYFVMCPSCQEMNYSTNSMTKANGATCSSCQSAIPGKRWRKTIEPCRGFWADSETKDAPLRKPERDFKTDDYYVGDLSARRINKYRFRVGDAEFDLESTANDSLAVVGQSDYYVCQICGYASEDPIGTGHRTAYGHKCSYMSEGGSPLYRLSHTFKTDVAKITFYTAEAIDQDTMCSVLYALLEGLSRSLGIERTDLKGVLHRVSWSGSERPIFSLILYDAVAGGAGHVRRIVTEDGTMFRSVLDAALDVVRDCNCDPSCYQCLRNYYNQKIHDKLNRNKASKFLENWVGEYIPVELEDSETNTDSAVILSDGSQFENEYSSWTECAEVYRLEQSLDEWDAVDVPRNCLLFPKLQISSVELSPYFAWPNAKLLVFETPEDYNAKELSALGWTAFDLTVAPETLVNQLGGNE